jgi:hypothetical protein
VEKPGLLSWSIPILAAATAVVTGWASHNMQMTIGTAGICYAVILGLALGAWFWQMRGWRKQENAKRMAFLNERLKCEGGCHDPWQPRQVFYELNGQRGVALPYVCPVCYRKFAGESPYGSQQTRRAFPDEEKV